MMEFINTNIVLLASVSAGLCVFFSAYIIIDFMLGLNKIISPIKNLLYNEKELKK